MQPYGREGNPDRRIGPKGLRSDLADTAFGRSLMDRKSAKHMVRFCILLLTSVAVAQHAVADGLSGKELERRVAGHTWAWTSEKFASKGVTTYYRDGRTIVRIDGLDQPQWGRWRIVEDKVCIAFVGNSESCSGNITEIDDRTLFSKSPETTFKLQE